MSMFLIYDASSATALHAIERFVQVGMDVVLVAAEKSLDACQPDEWDESLMIDKAA